MTEENSNIPELKSAEELQMAEIAPYLLDPRKNYAEPFSMYEYNGVTFSPLGGIQALSGQKKNGKTFVIAQLIAVALEPDSPRVHDNLPGLTVPQRTLEHLGHLPRVLWVDTEMEELNSAKVLRRVHWLVGQDMNIPHDRFFALWLRTVEKTDKEPAHSRRWRIIKMAIDVLKPDIVFIDGIRDIIGDFNDNQESSELIIELMAKAQENHMCIWSALHMNPRPRNDDESKMRGHLGTELGNKITDTLVCIKHKENGSVWFSVKQDDARGKDLDEWEFIVTDAAGSLGIPQMRHIATPSEKAEAEVQQARIEADDYFKLYNWTSVGATYTDLEKWLRSKGVTSNRRIKDLFDTALEAGIIYKNDKRKYYYKGLNNIVTNDASENLPFARQVDDDKSDF